MKKARISLLTTLLSLILLLGALMAAIAETTPQGGNHMDPTYDLRLSDEGTAYYISSSLGSDQNDGLSESTPWKSFDRIESMDLKPGDRVLLRRGDVWHERLTVRGNGRKDAWIFVGSYGDTADPKPQISLQNKKDDIALLATDISVGGQNGFGLNYIWIDNLHISHTLLGIYFRYDSSVGNKGIRVTNCSFSDINCPDLMAEAMTDVSFLTSVKGNLEDVQNGKVIPNAGGVAEYIWPTAVNIGGRPPKPMANVTVPGIAEPATAVSEIELYRNAFEDCIIAVGANCYNYHYGTGPNQCYTYTKNWRICGLTAKNTMTAVSIDSADFGYDGTPESPWGRWCHIQAVSGMADYTMSFGTTQALFSCCRDLYISHSSFNDCRNNGQPDGCGFDFERAVHNFTLDRCIIANNQGQGVLVMQTAMENQVTGETVTTPNTGNTIQNCLFYNNMNSVQNENYRFDITVFNTDNSGFTVRNNHFYFREKTAGGAEVFINQQNRKTLNPIGPERTGFTAEDNTLVQNNSLPPLDEVISELNMTDAAAEYLPLEKTWYHYTDEGAPLPETQPDTAAVSESSTEEAPGEPSATETESAPQGGCRAALCSAGLLAAVTAGAAGAGAASAKRNAKRKRD